jgi:hypothetical protein
MKQLPPFCLLVLLLLSGCASLQAERGVFENTFHSSYPDIQVKVSSEFEYIGEVDEAKTRQAQDSTYSGTVRSNWYVFAQADEEQRIKKAVSIRIQKAPTYFVSDIYGRVTNYYDRGTCKLGGVSWQYCSRLIYAKMSAPLTKFVSEQGYIIPRCVLLKNFSKVYGSKNNYLVTVSYWEAPPTADYDCQYWEPNAQLAHSQREYIEQFKKSSETSFRILKSGF